MDLKNDLRLIENGTKLLDPLKDIDEIYHYTSISSLKGIIKENEFWVSHSYFMNDLSEIIYTYDLIIDLLKELNSAESDLKIKKMYSILKSKIESCKERETSPGSRWNRSNDFRPSEYILSFSLNMDSMPLWSSFANCSGYNIGLDFNEYYRNLTDKCIASKVIYNREKQRDIIRCKIDEFKNIYIKHFDSFDNEKEAVFSTDFSSKIRLFANFFKNPVFESDEEFRIIFLNYKSENYVSPEYRTKDDILIPYIHSNDTKYCATNTYIPLRSITIGPTNYSDIAEEGLAYFLNDSGYDIGNIKICRSEIPLRY